MPLPPPHTPLWDALKLVKPEYFSWSQDQQDAYGVNLPKSDKSRILQRVYKDLFAIHAVTKEEQNAAYDGFTQDQLTQLNRTMLPLSGIGDNCLYLNEYMKDRSILDYETVYYYDADSHARAEARQQAEDPDYTPKPY